MAITQAHVTRAALSEGSFARIGESMEDACKRLLKSIKKRKPEVRRYPQGERAHASTAAYVREYYFINNLGDVDAFFAPLSTSQTVWPDPALETCEVEE